MQNIKIHNIFIFLRALPTIIDYSTQAYKLGSITIDIYNGYQQETALNNAAVTMAADSGFFYITRFIIPNEYTAIFYTNTLIDIIDLLSQKDIDEINILNIDRNKLIATQMSDNIEKLFYCNVAFVIDNTGDLFNYSFDTTLCDELRDLDGIPFINDNS